MLKSNLIRSIEFGSEGSTTFETGLILCLQHNMYATLPGAYQEIHLLECTVKHNKALEPPHFKNKKSNKPRVVFEKHVTNKRHFSFFNNVCMMLVPFTFLKSEIV